MLWIMTKQQQTQTEQVVTYQLSYLSYRTVSLCAECVERDDHACGSLGPVQHGLHAGFCDGLRHDRPNEIRVGFVIWAIGDKIEAGEIGTEDYDVGTILAVDKPGCRALVGWRSGVNTWIDGASIRLYSQSADELTDSVLSGDTE